MKIAIYSPYLDTFGGGERYTMTIAEIFASQDSVDILLDAHLMSFGSKYLQEQLQQRFELNLEKANFIKAPLGEGSSFWERLFFLTKYDLLFYLTDGSIFFPTAKKNILHIQSPLAGQPAKSLLGKLKLKSWNLIIYNSIFTKENSFKNWPINSEVVYPPVDVNRIKPLKKKKYILSVGRFFGYLKDKKHEILIRAFKNIYEDKGMKDWSLHLVGSAGKGDSRYLADLKDLAKGIPVKFYPNLDYDELIKLYGQACIYWHASGFGETNPAKMEHFGIATVEAMAGGCVPVVIGKGGQREIVENGKSGYLWESIDELKRLTLELGKTDDLRESVSKESIKRAKNFSKEIFKDKITKICGL